MCTHIIDFQDRKLKAFKGAKGNTLTMFAEKYPEKKAYFEPGNVTMKFAFPEPGLIEGKPTIVDVNLTVCVAVIGANGAGKYTAVNVLVGKQLPSSGSIWKNAGLVLRTWLSTPSTTLRSTCRRRRRCTSYGALRVTATRRASSSSLMSSPSMRSPAARRSWASAVRPAACASALTRRVRRRRRPLCTDW